jgi:hypothetical protein
MSSSTYRKTVYISYLIGICLVIAMPDMVFGTLLELGHILFEFIEEMLDKFVEHIFHTDLHQTQVIVFYLMLSIAFGGIYYLFAGSAKKISLLSGFSIDRALYAIGGNCL